MVNAAVCMMVLAATVAPMLEAATMVARRAAGVSEDLPLTREYASSIVTHYYKAGIAKYRKARRKDADGRVFFRLGICYTAKANRATGEDK